MRGVLLKTLLTAAVAGSALLGSAQANAHDHDWDRWDRWEHRHHHRERVVRERVVERPMVVEPPIVVAQPVPVYMAPVMPAYGGGGYHQDPSLNFNFSVPMR
jgi:hypothetical protein